MKLAIRAKSFLLSLILVILLGIISLIIYLSAGADTTILLVGGVGSLFILISTYLISYFYTQGAKKMAAILEKLEKDQFNSGIGVADHDLEHLTNTFSLINTAIPPTGRPTTKPPAPRFGKRRRGR